MIDRKQKLKTALRYFQPNVMPGPAVAPFQPVAKLGSTQSGSYVEGDVARGAGGQLLYKADGFIEDIDGIRRGPNGKTTITLNFYDRNTLDPLPGEVVYDYGSDISLADANPTSAPVNFDTELKPYLTGGTGVFSDSGLPGEITIGIIKQLWGEDNGYYYNDAVELGISMTIQSGPFGSNTPTSWLPIVCNDNDYAFIAESTFATKLFNINLKNFTRITPVTVENEVGSTASGEPGNDIIVTHANHDVGINANETLHFTIKGPGEGNGYAPLLISFDVRHDVTLQVYTIYKRINICWRLAFGSGVSSGLFQTIPTYSLPTLLAGCNTQSQVFADADSIANMSTSSITLFEGATDITPAGITVNSFAHGLTNYDPKTDAEVIMQMVGNADGGAAITSNNNVVQIIKEI